jgi:hypothetical protein
MLDPEPRVNVSVPDPEHASSRPRQVKVPLDVNAPARLKESARATSAEHTTATTTHAIAAVLMETLLAGIFQD